MQLFIFAFSFVCIRVVELLILVFVYYLAVLFYFFTLYRSPSLLFPCICCKYINICFSTKYVVDV